MIKYYDGNGKEIKVGDKVELCGEVLETGESEHGFLYVVRKGRKYFLDESMSYDKNIKVVK